MPLDEGSACTLVATLPCRVAGAVKSVPHKIGAPNSLRLRQSATGIPLHSPMVELSRFRIHIAYDSFTAFNVAPTAVTKRTSCTGRSAEGFH